MIQYYVVGIASEMIHCQVDGATNGKAYLNDNPLSSWADRDSCYTGGQEAMASTAKTGLALLVSMNFHIDEG
jgi:hypothetical protein